MKIVPSTRPSIVVRRVCASRVCALLGALALVFCVAGQEYALGQVSAPSQSVPQGEKLLNILVGKPRTPDKNTHTLAANDTAWFFRPQICGDPVIDSVSINLFVEFPSRRVISGRVDSVRIVAPPGSNFRLLAPLSPATIDVTSNNGARSVRIIASFSSNQFGVSTATLRTFSVDSAGFPIQRDFPIYTTRAQRSFEIVTKSYDFGTLPPNTPATVTIPFIRNTGNTLIDWEIPNFFGDFQVTNIRPTSTPAQGRPASTVILQPNDTAFVTVRFAGANAGQYVSYATNPRDYLCNIIAPTFTLEARTSQNPANITVTPSGALVNPIEFGDFACSNREAPYKDTTLRIYNSGQVTLRVTGANFSLPDYQIISPQTLSETAPLLVPFNQSREIIVRYTPRIVAPRERLAVLSLFSNAATGSPLGVTTVTVRAYKDSVSLAFSTQDVDFGAVPRDSPSPTRTVTITNTGTLGKAWVLPIALSNGFVLESITPAITPAGGTSQAVVRFSSTAVAGQFSTIWNVLDDCSRQTPVTVRISIDKPRPGIGVVSPIAFGVLSCSSDTTISITVRNTSNDGQDLIIQQLSILDANSPFSLDRYTALCV
jgi:hypothetical protein